MGGNFFDHYSVLSHGKAMLALGLAIPARYTGKAMRDVLNLNIHR
jgi:hypothetical protein